MYGKRHHRRSWTQTRTDGRYICRTSVDEVWNLRIGSSIASSGRLIPLSQLVMSENGSFLNSKALKLCSYTYQLLLVLETFREMRKWLAICCVE